MTITTQTLRNNYTANGSNTSFAFTFPIFYESNSTPKFSLEVITTDANGVETIKTETTDYTVTYSNLTNGIVAQGNVVFATAPTNGHKVSILRKLNITQNGDFTEKGTDALNGATLESALDKLTLLALQQQENLNRVIRVPKSSELTNIEFPIDASRANQVVVVNNNGNNLSTKQLADVGLAPVSPYIASLLDDTTASQARITLDAQQSNANLSSLAGLTGASNKLPYFTGAGAMAVRDLFATDTTEGVVLRKSPTIQKFTSGSGTYTTPSGVLYLKIKMVGGGGGGSGSGSGAGTGGTGGNSTFGTSLLFCGGGVGGIVNVVRGGEGGAASLGTGPIGTAIKGGWGLAPYTSAVAGTYAMGGAGANSPFGGAGAGAGASAATTGFPAEANSGSGGGGAGGSASTTFGGSGGGAGGYIDAIIASPLATYLYAIGSGGSGGSAGASGFVGGAGGSGYIEITEYYN